MSIEDQRFPDIFSAADWVENNTNLLMFSSRTQFIAVGYDEGGQEVCYVLTHAPHDPPCNECHRFERAVQVRKGR